MEDLEIEGDIGDTYLDFDSNLFVLNERRNVVLLEDCIIDTRIASYFENPLEKFIEQPGIFTVKLHNQVHKKFIKRHTVFLENETYSLYFGYSDDERIVTLRTGFTDETII